MSALSLVQFIKSNTFRLLYCYSLITFISLHFKYFLSPFMMSIIYPLTSAGKRRQIYFCFYFHEPV
ncbi:unnamed protein product [Moneuplotes crassus]|uniref:Uncharacterized protein n=1 Tax=Euplotes crassus TaxID=5936 RepID=A0AAD1XF56_EUPCR|nr:unnamed protein product [Moneuplotes crassus]